jgi:hypothetical protein
MGPAVSFVAFCPGPAQLFSHGMAAMPAPTAAAASIFLLETLPEETFDDSGGLPSTLRSVCRDVFRLPAQKIVFYG